MNLAKWQPYLISIVIGLLVGIEREKSQPDPKSIGVRTFLLISLLGTLAGELTSVVFSALISAFALGLIFIGYYTQSSEKRVHIDRGLTTEFAAGIVFALGFFSHRNPALSALLGPVVALILFAKPTLHRFTKAIRPSELEGALLLLLGGVALVNVVPNKTIDPWEIFNPQKFGFLVLTIATLEFSSYVLTKIMGEKKGSLVSGFFGGLVSSTAVLMSSARQARKTPGAWKFLLCNVLSSQVAALAELLLIVGFVATQLFKSVFLAVLTPILLLLILITVLSKNKEEQTAISLTIKSPLEWKGIFRLSILLALILGAISLAKHWLGDKGTLSVSFLTGMFELHGVSIANATMYAESVLSISTASLNIILSIIASLNAKLILSWVLSRGTFSKVLSIIIVILSVATLFVAWLTFH